MAADSNQSRAMLGFVLGALLGAACWAMIALVVVYGPARHVVVELWPLGLIAISRLAGSPAFRKPLRAPSGTRDEAEAARFA